MKNLQIRGWRNTTAKVLIGLTLVTGIKVLQDQYKVLNPIIKLTTENPSEKFNELYYDFFNERLDQDKKKEIEEFIKENDSSINLYSSELEKITGITSKENYSKQLIEEIEKQSKFENILKFYYGDTTSSKYDGRTVNTIKEYSNISKEMLKELNKETPMTEEGIKYLAKGKENLEKRTKYFDYITRFEVTKDLEARKQILKEYYADTTKNKEIYSWIENRTLKNLGYNSEEIEDIKKNGFKPREINERIKEKMEFMIEITKFYDIMAQENENPLFVKAVIMQESRFNKNAMSPANAKGYMQLMPATAKQYNVNPWNPAQNVRGGTRFLSDLKKKYEEYTPLTQKIFALIGYNWGPRNVARFMKDGILPEETFAYVPNVLSYEAGLDNRI